MNDDEFFKGLKGAALRDPEAGRAARWERLAAGRADGGERAALEQLARDDGDSDALDALAPASDAHLARVVQAIETVDAAPRDRPRTRSARIAPQAIAVGIGALAMAAGIALFVGRPPPASPPPELPAFALVVRGGEQATRSTAPPAEGPVTPVTLGPDSDLRIAIRPEHDITTPLEVRLFLREGSGLVPWNAPVVLSPAGAVQIEGSAKALIAGGNGPRELVIDVGGRGAVPVSGLLEPRDGVKVFRVLVHVIGR